MVEAEITGRLEHPGIVPVYGLGTYDDGRPFYAMRFIRGDNLKAAIEQFHKDREPGRDPGERTLALRKLLRRFLDVCNAIAYAHSRGVLHRDLKPGNIMLGKYGETLVVDWGLAKTVGRPERAGDGDAGANARGPPSGSDVQPTEIGSRLGTPAYMSPEQAAGRLDELGPASDVYSLGATLYCLLTGKAAVRRTRDLVELLRKVERGEFPPPRQVKPGVDPAAGGDLPEGDGDRAGGPLRHARGPGRRRRALAGRRARSRPGASRGGGGMEALASPPQADGCRRGLAGDRRFLRPHDRHDPAGTCEPPGAGAARIGRGQRTWRTRISRTPAMPSTSF